MYKKQTQSNLLRSRLRLFFAIPALAIMMMPLAGVAMYAMSNDKTLSSGTVYAQDPAPAAGAQPTQTTPNIEGGTRNTSTCPKGDCIIEKYVNPGINAISAMVGVAVTISIIYGGIQYASSADNSQKVSEAKQRIVNSIFVLIGYLFFYAFLNYIIPGGLV